MSELVIQGLTRDLQPLARELLRRAALEGLETIVPKTGGARTSAEQMKRYALGRHHDATGRWVYDDPITRKGVVTNAQPHNAPHCHRAAIDVELLERGRVLTLGPDLGAEERAKQLVLYCKLGRIGEDLGLVWGGRWASIRDFPHFELKAWKHLPLVT